MKIKEFDESTELRKKTKLCLMNTSDGNNCYKFAIDCIERAKNIEDFRKIFFEEADDKVKLSKGYAELSKEDILHWHRVRDMFSEATKLFKLTSDAGGVLIGREPFYTIINNGYRDGRTRVALFSGDEAKNFNNHMMNFSQMLIGEFDVHACDTSNHVIVATLKGKWLVYNYEGLVAFEGSKDSEVIIHTENKTRGNNDDA